MGTCYLFMNNNYDYDFFSRIYTTGLQGTTEYILYLNSFTVYTHSI